MQNLSGDFKYLSDDILVSLAQDSNSKAFAELITRHYTASMRLAISVLRDPTEAEDAIQNAFWRAFVHINQFQGEAKFSSWLGSIVVNQCLMRLRQVRRSRFYYFDELAAEQKDTMEFSDTSQTPEELFGQNEVAGVLQKEIGRIPPLLRNVFVLRDVEQLPMIEVANRLGISVAAAKSRLLRSRSELRSRLAKHEGRRGLATLLPAPRMLY